MCFGATMAEVKSSSMPPYCSGMVMPVEAQFGGFAQQATATPGSVVLDGFHVGADFLGPEFVGRAGDGVVFRSEIFRGEDFVGRRSSMRNAPPLVLGNEIAAVAVAI
jgi:hypothetical protein